MRFPPEHRSFLLEVSAGGAGPNYGVSTLFKDEQGRWGWSGGGTAATSLATPFDPTGGEQLRALRAAEPEEGGAAYDQWQESLDDLLWADDRTSGAVCVRPLGCGTYAWLIVRGPEQDQNWLDARGEGFDLYPEGPAVGGR